jgi:hypothetical protein
MIETVDLIPIPKERTIIDAISLDEEMQLEREDILFEYGPIVKQRANFIERASYDQPQTLDRYRHLPGLTILQNMYLEHLIYIGEIGAFAVVGLTRDLNFTSAQEILKEKFKGLPLNTILEAADLGYSLRIRATVE